MPPKNKSLLILVAGPYRSNTGDDPEKIANNLHDNDCGQFAAIPFGAHPRNR